jgi:hypothetical protein
VFLLLADAGRLDHVVEQSRVEQVRLLEHAVPRIVAPGVRIEAPVTALGFDGGRGLLPRRVRHHAHVKGHLLLPVMRLRLCEREGRHPSGGRRRFSGLSSRAGVGVQQRLPRFKEALDELVRHVERCDHAVS